MKTQAIIPAAGLGERLKATVPKALVELNGKPLLVYTLESFVNSSLIDSIILVVPSQQVEDFEKLVSQYSLTKVNRIVAGGQTRCESVCNGLNVSDEDTEVIVVHDGARPLIEVETIDAAVRLCKEYDAVVVAVPVKPTIKEIDRENLIVMKTLDRGKLWEVQTPQVFKKEILVKAHQKGKGSNPTDDASLVEQLGIKVKVLKGDYKNLKITTKEDLVVAEALLKLHENKNKDKVARRL